MNSKYIFRSDLLPPRFCFPEAKKPIEQGARIPGTTNVAVYYICAILWLCWLHASNKQKYLFLCTSFLHFQIWNYNKGQDCYYFIINLCLFIYLLCSRKDLRQHNIWISDLCSGAVVFDFFKSNPLVNDWYVNDWINPLGLIHSHLYLHFIKICF